MVTVKSYFYVDVNMLLAPAFAILAPTHKDDAMKLPRTRWARNIHRLIRERGLTQGDVAIRAGLNQNALSRMLRATSAKTANLEEIAKVIGVDVSELFAPEKEARAGVLPTTRDLLRELVREEVATTLAADKKGPAHAPRSSRRRVS